MQLNLPITHLLQDSQTILIAGAGGGFDIFAGLPLYFTLREMGKTVHLANYTFTPLELVTRLAVTVNIVPNILVGARPTLPDDFPFNYYPEGYLARWFQQEQQDDITIWMFAKTGVQPLLQSYRTLIDNLGIDALLLVDGGVDSLMIGNEEGAGTLLEDTITLTAARELDLPVKLLACLGFGAENEVSHANALYNMAELARLGAFYGACALTQAMPVYQLYEAACRYVWEQPDHHKSHISTRIVSATLGHYGNHHLYNEAKSFEVFVSPLMSLYWFYNATAVNVRSLLADTLLDTHTFNDAMTKTLKLREMIYTAGASRRHRTIPY